MQKNCTTMPQVNKVGIAFKPFYRFPLETLHVRRECQPEDFSNLHTIVVSRPAAQFHSSEWVPKDHYVSVRNQ